MSQTAVTSTGQPPDTPDLVPYLVKIVVDTREKLDGFLRILCRTRKVLVDLFLDAEGWDHGKDGTLATIQVTFASITCTAFILDVLALKRELFDRPGPDGRTFKAILEDPSILKVWFDVRQDSAAIFWQYDIKMEGVIDLQLMENGARGEARRYLYGLDTCFIHLNLNPGEQERARDTKKQGKDFCDGDFTKWRIRPLPTVLLDYAAGDTVYMPYLYTTYLARLQEFPYWQDVILVESMKRVKKFQGSDPLHSRGKAPWAFERFDYHHQSDHYRRYHIPEKDHFDDQGNWLIKLRD